MRYPREVSVQVERLRRKQQKELQTFTARLLREWEEYNKKEQS